MRLNTINRWLSVALATATIPLATHAATHTWSGASSTSANWSDPANWDAAIANGDALIFTGGTQVANINDLSNLTLGWMLFDGNGFSVSGNAVTLAAGLTNDASASGATVGMNVFLSAPQTFESDGGDLAFTGAITNNGYALSITGPGNVVWPQNATAGIKGAGNVVMNGSGILTWTGAFVNGTVLYGYTGNTIVNSGSMVNQGSSWSANSAIGASLTVNPGATFENDGVHFMSYDGRPMTNYGGVINLTAGGYVANITLSNAVINGPGNMSCNYYNTRDITVLASPSPSLVAAGITLSTAYGTTGDRTFNVADGPADPDLEVSGVINGTGALTKTGAGKLLLSGSPSTYAGNTIISAGTIALSGGANIQNSPLISLATNTVLDVSLAGFSVNPNQTLAGIGSIIGTVQDNNTGSVISPGGSGVAGTLTIDTLNLSGNVALNFDLSTNAAAIGGGTNDLLVVTNLSLSNGATNTVNLSAIGGTLPKGVPFTLIKYTTCSAPAGVITTLATPPSHFIYSFANDVANSRITVTISGNPFNLVWKGDGLTNAWDITTTANWLVGGVTPDLYYDGDNTTFSGTGSASPAINVTTTVKPTTMTVNSPTDYIFAGAGKISGGTTLLKSNSGKLTLLTPNDFSGGGSLNGSGVVNVGNSVVAGNLGSGNLTNNTVVNFNFPSSATYAGNMSGSGSVSAFMPGATLTLTGSNSFTGGLVISNGTLQIGNNPAIAGATVAGTITNYATLYYSRSDAFTLANNITSAGNTLEYGNGDVNVRGLGGMTVDGTAGINIMGSLSVAQSMYGKLTINPGANINTLGYFLIGNPASYGGDVIQTGGSVTANNTVRIGHWPTEISTYTMSGGTLNVPNAQLAVGWDGIGLMNMSGGTVNCRTLNVDDNGATAAISGTNSTFTLTGGRVNIGTGGIGGNTATINLGGGTIAAAAPAGFSSGMAMVLTNGNPTFDTSNSVITLSGSLSGANGFTKQGSGYLNLNGTNIFTGPVTVAQGTLQGTGTNSGPVTVLSGAALSAGGAFSAGTFTLTNLTLNPGAGLTFDLSSTAATGDQLVVRGALALDTATPATFNFLGGTPYTNGPYTLITNWLAGRTGHLVYNNPSTTTRYAVNIDESNPNRIQASFTGTNATLVWNGSVNNLWDVNTDANWLNGGALDKYFQSDAVVFDDSGLGSPNVMLSGTITPASVTVNSSGNYTFSGGDLAGLGSLTKSGTGTLNLANNVSLLGAITVGGGTLSIGNGGTSGYVDGNILNFGSVVFNRADAVSYGVNPVNQASVVITGPGSLTQAGPGKLFILSTQNHYGGTTINPGATLQLGTGPIVDSGSLGNSPAVNYGSVIFYRLSSIAVATPYSGPGSLTFLGTSDSGQSAYSLNATNTFTGPVSLSYARIQSGAGALSFGSPSSITVPPASQVYAVATPYSYVYNIPLTLAGTGWQDGLGALRIENSGMWAGPITLAANARIGVNNATTNFVTGAITGNYELETYGGNALASLVLAPATPNTFNALRVSIGTAGATTIAGNANAIPSNIPLTMNGGTLRLNGFGNSFAPFLNLNSGSSIQNGSLATPANVTLTVPAGANWTYSGNFADGATAPLNVTLNQSGPGAATILSGNSAAWTGNFTNNGGTITVNATGGKLGVANLASRTVVFNNSTINLSPNNAWSGSGALTTIMLNNSTFYCTRYNSFGPFVLNGSTLTGANASDAGYWTWSLYGGAVTVTGNAPSYMGGTGAGYGYALQTPTVFNVAHTGSSGPDLTVSAPLRSGGSGIGGPGALIKTGAGTMLVTDVATYSGLTTISNGVLAIGTTGSIASSPSIIVGSGATLDVSAAGMTLGAQTLTGSGTVVGNLTDGTGSVISPGTGVGTLTINGSLSLSGAGTLAVDLANTATVGGGINDLLQVNGGLNLATTTPTPVSFNFINGAPALGVYYTLISATGPITGAAATAFSNASRYTATFSQVGNTVGVTFSGGATNLVWTGTDPAIPATWDVSLSTNWFDGTGGNVFYQLDKVRFDNTSLNTTVAISGSVNPSTIVFDSTNNYTLNGSGKITGHTTITKNNTNTVILGTVNTFAGTVNVNGGTLALSVNESIPAGTTVIVSNGAAFDFAGYNNNTTLEGSSYFIAGSGPSGSGSLLNDTYDIYSYANVSNLTLLADAVIGGTTRWDIGPNANSKLDGQGHNLVKVGTGSIDMRAQIITNLASLTVSNGLMWYESFSQTNAWTTNSTNFIKPGAVLGNYGGQTVNLPISLDSATIQNQGGSGTPTWTGPMVIQTASLFNNSTLQAFYGPISGPGGINVNGGQAVLTISNANTYAGGTIISNGPVTASSADATAGSAAVVAGNPSAFGTGPIIINGTSYPSLSTNTAFFSNNVFRAVEFNFPAPGTVSNAIVLPTSVVTNVSLHGHDSAQVINLAGVISGGMLGLTNWVDFGDATVLGVMRYGNPANTFLGTIGAFRGVLAITADGSLGNAANILRLNNPNGLRFDAPGINVAHGLSLTTGTTFNVYGDNDGDGIPETGNNATISGIIAGTAGLNINITGGTNYGGNSYGSLTLSGVNTFNDQLTVLANTKLIAASAAAMGGATYYAIVNNGATLSLNLNGTYNTRALQLSGMGVLSGGVGVGALENLAGANVFNSSIQLNTLSAIGVTSGSLSLGGAISGAYPLLKTGPGTLTLGAVNTYTAGTFVNAGTLFLNGSLPVGNSVIVASGATFGGNGTVNGPVSIQPGAAFSPGVNGIGKLIVNSTLNLAGTTTMEINKALGTNDAVTGLSSVVYGGTLIVNNLGGSLTNGDKFTLFSALDRQGSFSSITLPTLGSGLAWTNMLTVNGSLQVYALSTVNPGRTNLSWSFASGSLTLSWPADHIGWRLLAQTNNLATGVSTNLADWATVPGSTSTNQVVIPVDPAKPTSFYKMVYP